METIKLIPMTQFVIEQSENLVPTKIGNHLTDMLNYAKFLSQPLTLSMFVPTTEAGEVLEEPEMYMTLQNVGSMNSHATEQDCIDAENFHRAKSRCLFEGLSVIKSDDGYTFYNKANHMFFYNFDGSLFTGDIISPDKYLIHCVEELIGMDGLTLTPTAKELIYGTSR